MAKAATHAVSLHGRTERATDGETDLHRRNRSVVNPDDARSKRTRSTGTSGPFKQEEVVSVRKRSDHALSRWRPLSLRARSTARPPRVDARWRNPCFLDRLRVLGWNVRFDTGHLVELVTVWASCRHRAAKLQWKSLQRVPSGAMQRHKAMPKGGRFPQRLSRHPQPSRDRHRGPVVHIHHGW
jgi:hypothetical protein